MDGADRFMFYGVLLVFVIILLGVAIGLVSG
jgi:uncharacterized membrane protein